MLFASSAAHAQQRSIVNPSFEDVSSVPGLGNGFEITPDTNVPGWQSTDGEIEIWVDGFQNKASQDGDYFIELNPRRPIGLYQEVCLVNGEVCLGHGIMRLVQVTLVVKQHPMKLLVMMARLFTSL